MANASFVNLRAEGAFLISALHREGRTEWVKIYSEVGGPCIVKNPYQGCVYLFKGEKLWGKFEKKKIKFNTKKGENFLLLPANKINNLTLYTPERFLKEKNYFGVKKIERF